MRNTQNPFKFGTIVEEEYFTDRKDELQYIKKFINGPNHLVIISPRRFGKSSLVNKAVKQTGRKAIVLNLQQITSQTSLAAKLLREFFKVFPLEKVKHLLANFRVIPIVSTNPFTGQMDVSFHPNLNQAILLEDVFGLIEHANSKQNRIVIVLDEFQEIRKINPNLDKTLRSLMQNQNNINYILLGSQESLMTDIFENKKSPFYHFGQMMRIGKLPRKDFHRYLTDRLEDSFPGTCEELANEILDYTECHPYYTQQLAANVWQTSILQPDTENPVNTAIQQIITTHDLDYERLWSNFNKTNKWIMQQLALGRPLQTGEYRTSTIYSALKRLQTDGYAKYSDKYEIEDPFFKEWIKSKQ